MDSSHAVQPSPIDPPAVPSFWQRLFLNGLFWTPVLVYLFAILPQFFPIYAKFEEKDALSPAQSAMMALVLFVQKWAFIPLLVAVSVFVAIDHIFALKSRSSLGRTYFKAWTIGTRLLALVLFVAAYRASLLPVFRNPGP